MLQQLPPLDPHLLPGPDTTTKLAAAQDPDIRYQHMLREAVKIAWPAAYADDLYLHDRHILAGFPGEPMLWVLRSHGTHLFPLACDSAGQADYAKEVIRYWSGDHKLNVAECEADRARYYVVTRGGIRQITAQAAGEAIEVSCNGATA
ncbi:hypothetical protein OAS39_08325 [Pirellulales bacterium]|nr:hypothetical protein [Pirellulales bacterium]